MEPSGFALTAQRRLVQELEEPLHVAAKRLQYVEQNRVGDHICYISDLRRLKADYPGWDLTRSLDDILRKLAAPPAA